MKHTLPPVAVLGSFESPYPERVKHLVGKCPNCQGTVRTYKHSVQFEEREGKRVLSYAVQEYQCIMCPFHDHVTYEAPGVRSFKKWKIGARVECPCCEATFTQAANNQRYCSEQCRLFYRGLRALPKDSLYNLEGMIKMLDSV